ncbi:MAG: hypothetical protein QW303_03275 [Nitrososphaerota archaeon]
MISLKEIHKKLESLPMSFEIDGSDFYYEDYCMLKYAIVSQNKEFLDINFILDNGTEVAVSLKIQQKNVVLTFHRMDVYVAGIYFVLSKILLGEIK